MKRIIAFILSTLLATSLMMGDVFIKKVSTNRAGKMMGKQIPEKTEIEKVWMKQGKTVVVAEEYKLIFDLEKKQLTVVVDDIQKYISIPLDLDKHKLAKLLPPKIIDIIFSAKISDVKADINTGSKKIGQWNCTSNDLHLTIKLDGLGLIVKIKAKSWVTENVPDQLFKYQESMSRFFKNLFMSHINLDDASKAELEKLEQSPGIEVGSDVVVNMFGSDMQIESRCLEITEKEAPKDLCTIPGSYTQIVNLKQLMSCKKH